MCFPSPKMPTPPPPPPPPPPPSQVATNAPPKAKRGKAKSRRRVGTVKLNRSPKMGGSYKGSGVNLPS